MNIERFLQHHGLVENPFDAEEARHDPIFGRIVDEHACHPDFAKILGQIDRPSTAIVFGEKGSGKTAIRLMIGRRVAQFNAQRSTGRTLLIAYDDLNPMLDQLMARRNGDPQNLDARDIQRELEHVRLEDHQDTILSLAVTKFVDAIVDPNQPESHAGPAGEGITLKGNVKKTIKALPRQLRADLAVLAALYDHPKRGSVSQRFSTLRHKLRLGLAGHAILAWVGLLLTVGAGGLLLASWLEGWADPWLLLGGSIAAAAVTLLWTAWAWRRLGLWGLVRRVRGDIRAVERPRHDLRRMLGQLRPTDLEGQPWPIRGNKDSRYQLTTRLLGVLQGFGYDGMIVLVDRVDEPSLVSGDPHRMVPLVWPMLDNKFLQQEGVGLKLLLPIELRHALHRESSQFFQEARLDKQNLIDRLTWSGTTLYDLCTRRLLACWRPASPSQAAYAEPTAFAAPESSAVADVFVHQDPVHDQGQDAHQDHGQGHDDDDTLALADEDEREDGGDDTIAMTRPASRAPSPAQVPSAPPASSHAQPSPGAPASQPSIALVDLFEPDVTRQVLIDALDQMQQPRDAFKFLYAVLQEHCRSIPDDQASFRVPKLVLDSVRRQQAQRVTDLYRGVSPA